MGAHGTSRGFSLIELAIVVAIGGVLAALTIGGLEALKVKAETAGSAGEMIASLRKTQAEAFGRGTYTAFVIDTAGKRWWGIEAPTGTVNLDTFTPSSPGTVIASGTLPSAISFGPSAGYGALLPAPFATVPVISSQSPRVTYCSFCRPSGTNAGFGAIVFEPAGQVTFSDPTLLPAGTGQQFTLRANASNAVTTIAVAIIQRTGDIETFER